MPSKEILEHADSSEWDFVGRKTDFRKLDEAWGTVKLFGVFGIRSVGKSSFVREYLKTKDVRVIHVELKYINSVETLHSNICALFGQQPQYQVTHSKEWIKQIITIIAHASESEKLAIYFDNAEDVVEGDLKDNFLSLISKITIECRNSIVFITSTTRVQFSQLKFFSYELHPLLPSEGKELLKTVDPEVDLDEYGDVIIKLSEGLPLIIRMIGAELKEDDGLLTPLEMVELLCKCRLETLSNKFYPEEDRVGTVFRNFIFRLSGEFRNYMSVLDYIPGSFNAQEAGGLLDIATEAKAKQKVLIPIRRRHMLNYDPKKCRFDIQGILREGIKAHLAIKDLPELRRRYCKVFTDVMRKISSQMGTEEYTRAYSEFAVEQPNLQKLLGEVEYTREDTYNFFIEIVSSYTPVIETFMSHESEFFYDACLRLTERYQRTGDKAKVHIAVGSLFTNTKGDFHRGADNYQTAMIILEKGGKSLQLASVYQRMGWNLHRRGRNADAIQYFKKSLDISVYGGTEYESLAMQSLSSMGISLTYLGNFERAEKYHVTCLNRRKALLGEYHPSVGAAVNNIGLLMEHKGDAPRALDYYLKALEIKRKSKAPAISLINSLCNVANSYSIVGRYGEAHGLLDEAIALIKDQKGPMKDAEALVFHTRGKVYAKGNDLRNANKAFAMTIELSRQISLEGFYLMKRLVDFADVQEREKDYLECKKTVQEALKLKNESIKTLPHNTITIECLECLAKVYKATGKRLDYVQVLYDIETECLRLERVCREQDNIQTLEKISDKLWDIRRKMEHLSL